MPVAMQRVSGDILPLLVTLFITLEMHLLQQFSDHVNFLLVFLRTSKHTYSSNCTCPITALHIIERNKTAWIEEHKLRVPALFSPFLYSSLGTFSGISNFDKDLISGIEWRGTRVINPFGIRWLCEVQIWRFRRLWVHHVRIRENVYVPVGVMCVLIGMATDFGILSTDGQFYNIARQSSTTSAALSGSSYLLA